MHQLATTNAIETPPLLLLWLASQRPGKHFLVRCEPGGFDVLGEQVETLGVPPVWLCRLPGTLVLPPAKQGTLLLNDVAALQLKDQIALYDWLGRGAAGLRVISVTTSSLAELVARGRFLEGLFHRLSDVQFDLTSRESAR